MLRVSEGVPIWCSGDDGSGFLVINLPGGDFISNNHIMIGESDRAQKQSAALVTFRLMYPLPSVYL
jgi:hypothetical protein